MNSNLKQSIWKGQNGTLHPYYPKEQMSLISWQRFPVKKILNKSWKWHKVPSSFLVTKIVTNDETVQNKSHPALMFRLGILPRFQKPKLTKQTTHMVFISGVSTWSRSLLKYFFLLRWPGFHQYFLVLKMERSGNRRYTVQWVSKSTLLNCNK